MRSFIVTVAAFGALFLTGQARAEDPRVSRIITLLEQMDHRMSLLEQRVNGMGSQPSYAPPTTPTYAPAYQPAYMPSYVPQYQPLYYPTSPGNPYGLPPDLAPYLPPLPPGWNSGTYNVGYYGR